MNYDWATFDYDMDEPILSENEEQAKEIDRFDVEGNIMQCWGILDDLKLINESNLDPDEKSKMIESLANLYSLKFSTLLTNFGNLMFQTQER